MKKYRISLQWKFFLCIVLIIFPILGVIFTWTGVQNESQAMEQVLNQARILARQVILTRQWISDCGGIMVPKGSKGAQDVSDFFDDSLETSRGTYRRFTPSMATKKLSQYSNRQDLYRFRITSLNPLNPNNMPDEVEEDALRRFKEEGLTEMVRFEARGEKEQLHYVVPLYMEKACLECHKRPGKYQGVVGGGLSIFLPMKKIKVSIKEDHIKLAVFGAGFISLTILTLFFLLGHVVMKPMKALDKMASEIGKGNLEARANINTGDEFENLGQSFNNMAERISEGREFLEERIAQATQELSLANRELETLDKLKSDFLANMSHELRTPLTVIRGGIDYLNRKIEKEDNRGYLEIIDKNLTRLTHLVSDLFNFTKLEAKKVEWSFEEENLAVLIQEVIEIIGPLAVDNNISIRYENPGDIMADLDLERMEQVLVNLIENAVKFSDPHTEIDIKIDEDEDFATVSIKDYGIGIPEENLKTIFDKFSTVPSGKGGKTEGTGLGLAICKAIVEAHGGAIWAESVKGELSTFYFTVPKKKDHNT
ncbi:ATP-binding protein [Thermodesulfobacteriota bacterium]